MYLMHHLKCDVIYLYGLYDSLHPDTLQTQRDIAFAHVQGEPEISKSNC